ncbi:unnamed protein product [Kluyveromyces dobzhanskii CBS 2104]|uniref:WGS project CCBQ000000000 data, contig 00007 n=1 Tax=Kluyveromyces dobzhanskii CBS 2104 TaxID=1427455 RepID=A0A0A8L2Y3_9SACH|nr:unnamed protein product [Kluyveromyces dobzhanskii CBS 2104]
MVADDNYMQFVTFRYQPSKAAAIASCAIFSVLFLGLLMMIIGSTKRFEEVSAGEIHNVKRKTVLKYFPFLMGIVMEVVGYGMRYDSSLDIEKITPFVIQSVFLLVAPSLYASTIYTVFGQLTRTLKCTRLSIVPAHRITAIFILGNLAGAAMQGAGVGVMSSAETHSGVNTGSHVIIAGLFIQIAVFGLFMITELRLLLQAKHTNNIVSQLSSQWYVLSFTLLGMSVFIMIRFIVRAVEFIEGGGGYIMGHECFLYVFDTMLMMLATLLWIITFRIGDLLIIICEVVAVAANIDIGVEDVVDNKPK